jgi:hypothetical protein
MHRELVKKQRKADERDREVAQEAIRQRQLDDVRRRQADFKEKAQRLLLDDDERRKHRQQLIATHQRRLEAGDNEHRKRLEDNRIKAEREKELRKMKANAEKDERDYESEQRQVAYDDKLRGLEDSNRLKILRLEMQINASEVTKRQFEQGLKQAKLLTYEDTKQREQPLLEDAAAQGDRRKSQCLRALIYPIAMSDISCNILLVMS